VRDQDVGAASLAPAVACVQRALAISQHRSMRNFGILDRSLVAEYTLIRELPRPSLVVR
jgi:hypothetical protein